MAGSRLLGRPHTFTLRPHVWRRFVALKPAASSQAWPTVVLKKGKARLFRAGSPLVYGGAVERIAGGTPHTADCVVVHDHNLEHIGWGFFCPASMYRVRLMQLAEEMQATQQQLKDMDAMPRHVLSTSIKAAVQLRRMLQLPSSSTNAFRLINSEGDRLSGLIVDVLGETLVVASSSAWVEKYRPDIESCLQQETGLSKVVWKRSAAMLAEEGLQLPAATSPHNEGGSTGGQEQLLENGVHYAADLGAGQKTGFFCDQRDSRALIRSLASGSDVLDLCCYTGGFALSAALGGASSVLAHRNAELNGVSERVSFCKADVADYMREARGQGKTWDLIILDPPKLAPNKKALERAEGKYKRLNAAAMAITRPGGLLMTCSCSGAVTQADRLLPILQDAAQHAKRHISVLRHAGPAPDHVLNPGYPEGQYLTNILLRVL